MLLVRDDIKAHIALGKLLGTQFVDGAVGWNELGVLYWSGGFAEL